MLSITIYPSVWKKEKWNNHLLPKFLKSTCEWLIYVLWTGSIEFLMGKCWKVSRTLWLQLIVCCFVSILAFCCCSVVRFMWFSLELSAYFFWSMFSPSEYWQYTDRRNRWKMSLHATVPACYKASTRKESLSQEASYF